MDKLLIIGINTRSILNSALNLNYEVYSTSYFSTSDAPNIKNQKIILKETDGESCGVFEDKFSSENILEISKEYLNEVDYIIPVSGISSNDFKKKHQKKILGNINVENIEDKLKFYNNIKDEFLTPKTFSVVDMYEAMEINKNYPNIQFILKPLQGSGGYDVNLLNNDSNIQFNDKKFIMQEYVSGINLSSSLLTTKNETTIITNTRLLTLNDYNQKNNFKYSGNILPLTNKIIKNDTEINKEMELISKNLAEKFKIIGSNGIDYILNEKGLYVLEINPRIQGTFECIEKTFKINMLEAHIKACEDEIINIPKAKYYTYKKIIYSPTKNKYHKLNLNNIYDLPYIGSITESNEPLLTIIDKSKNYEKLIEKVELTSKIVNKNAIKYQLNE